MDCLGPSAHIYHSILQDLCYAVGCVHNILYKLQNYIVGSLSLWCRCIQSCWAEWIITTQDGQNTQLVIRSCQSISVGRHHELWLQLMPSYNVGLCLPWASVSHDESWSGLGRDESGETRVCDALTASRTETGGIYMWGTLDLNNPR